MAIHASHITVLIFGFIFLINQYSAPVVADSSNLNGGTVDYVQRQPGEEDYSDKIEHAANTEKNADILATEEKDNDFPTLRSRGITIGGVTFGSSNDMQIETSSYSGGGKRLQLYNVGGITIRAVDLKNHRNIMISNNQIFVGGKLVCKDILNVDKEVQYRKTSDGTYWYTNVKMGDPMTEAEIKEFEDDWDQYEKEKAEKKRQKEAEKRQRKEEKRAEQETKRQQKEYEKTLQRKAKAERKERGRTEKKAAKVRSRRAKEYAKTGKKQRQLDDDEEY